MATTSMAVGNDAVYSAHLIDRAAEFTSAIAKAIEAEQTAMALKPFGPDVYHAWRRLSLRYVDDALEVGDEEWVAAWKAAGKRRLDLIATFQELGAEYLVGRAGKASPLDPTAVKASVDELFHTGLAVVAAICKETR